MMKKVLSILLALTMSAMTFAACGAPANSAASSAQSTAASGAASTVIDMNEEPYTVAIQVVTLPGTNYEGKEDREAAINAITVPAINCKVEIQEVWISEVANTTNLAVAGDEKIDLVHVATVNSLSALVGSDILYDMNTDNLLQTRGKTLVSLFGDLLEAGYANDQQLAVPAKIFNASAKGINYNKKLTDACNITVPETMDMDGLEELLYAFKEANDDVDPYFVGKGDLNTLFWLQGYERFGNEASYGAILDTTGELKLENLYASDMFKDYCLRMYKWRVDGIHSGDATDTNPRQTYFAAEQLLTNTVDINPMMKSLYGSQASFEVGYSQLVGPTITNSSITEYMWGIASNSERPDKAMDFLNFLYENAQVANILQYGIEGVNFDFQEGSDKVIVLNNTYAPMFYFAGNSKDMYVAAPASEDHVEQQIALEAKATVSPVCNYMFNDSQFQTESSVIYSTIIEYLPRLQNGIADSEEATIALIDEFNAKLVASGINDVIAANQEQLDAWLATQ